MTSGGRTTELAQPAPAERRPNALPTGAGVSPLRIVEVGQPADRRGPRLVVLAWRPA